ACLDAGDGMVILERRAAVTDGTWRLTGIFQGRLTKRGMGNRKKWISCALWFQTKSKGRLGALSFLLSRCRSGLCEQRTTW
ncbi:hypothetical protein, partial [Xanthomonas fragariae]